MYSLSCMTVASRRAIDPCIPTVQGRNTSVFYWPGRHCLHRARGAVRCWASRMKGELHPIKKTLFRRVSCIWMAATMHWFSFWCGYFQRQQWVYYVAASWVPFHKHTLRDTTIPLLRSKRSPHKKKSNSTANRGNRQEKKNTLAV